MEKDFVKPEGVIFVVGWDSHGAVLGRLKKLSNVMLEGRTRHLILSNPKGIPFFSSQRLPLVDTRDKIELPLVVDGEETDARVWILPRGWCSDKRMDSLVGSKEWLELDSLRGENKNLKAKIAVLVKQLHDMHDSELLKKREEEEHKHFKKLRDLGFTPRSDDSGGR